MPRPYTLIPLIPDHLNRLDNTEQGLYNYEQPKTEAAFDIELRT